VGKQQHYFAM